MSLRARLSSAAGLTVAVAIVAAAIVVYVAVRSELRGEVDDSLHASAARLAGAPLLDRFDQGHRPPAPPEQPFGGARGYLQLVREDGATLRPPDESGALPVDATTLRLARRGGKDAYEDVRVAGKHLRVLVIAPAPGFAVQFARPLDEVDRVLADLTIALAIVAAAAVALGAGLGAALARAALRPVTRFAERTEALVGAPDPAARLDVVGRDELTRLALSFNETLDALQRSVESQRHLVADASHELRTPLTSARTNVALLARGDELGPGERALLVRDIAEQLEELSKLVGDVVELARGAEPPTTFEDVRLDELVEAAIDRARRLMPGLRFEASLEPSLVHGSPDRLHRAISNLLDNAGKWSPEQATIDVAVRGGEVTVRDHGPGFAEADLPFVFDRFYRATAARGMPGSGLGLAIVRQVAEAHGGSVRASNAPGGGALLTLALPAEQVADAPAERAGGPVVDAR